MSAACGESSNQTPQKLRLTNAEREAIEAAARIIDAYEEEMDGFSSNASTALRGLLKRTLTTNPDEVSVHGGNTQIE